MINPNMVENIAIAVYLVGGIACLTGLLFLTFSFLEIILDKIMLWKGIFAVIKNNRELFTKSNRELARSNKSSKEIQDSSDNFVN